MAFAHAITIGYWNEARILEPVNFDTIKELPNIPGNVNNFLAGRTYPLEGAAMPLPQHAPYTEPLEILICGGSTEGAGEASDNCVSLQPEAAEPKWIIERMVSIPRTLGVLCTNEFVIAFEARALMHGCTPGWHVHDYERCYSGHCRIRFGKQP